MGVQNHNAKNKKMCGKRLDLRNSATHLFIIIEHFVIFVKGKFLQKRPKPETDFL